MRRQERPWLLSVGVASTGGLIRWHRYYEVRRKHPLRTMRILGLHVTWTSYRRRSEDP